jgi:hypothetical protein
MLGQIPFFGKKGAGVCRKISKNIDDLARRITLRHSKGVAAPSPEKTNVTWRYWTYVKKHALPVEIGFSPAYFPLV